jgi:predicted signal transduction protein with EAL and GGDEF domain
MLPEVDNPGMAAAVWGKLKLALGEPYIIDGYQVRLTTSMGGVVYPTDAQTDEELIRLADGALYRAKARSGNASIKALPRETLMDANTQYRAPPRHPRESHTDDLELQPQSNGTMNRR